MNELMNELMNDALKPTTIGLITVRSYMELNKNSSGGEIPERDFFYLRRHRIRDL